MAPSITKPRRVTLADVAARAGVSPMTVSVVMSGSGGNRVRVGAETAERVRKAATELAYRPSLVAQQMAGKSSRTIGVLAQDWFHSLPMRFAAWLTRFANDRDFRIMALPQNQWVE